jgi:predicted site-specific integrase-resolvase
MTSVLPPISENGNYKKVEVAKILGIGRTTLDNHIKSGDIRINIHRYTTRITIKGSEIIRFFNSKL